MASTTLEEPTTMVINKLCKRLFRRQLQRQLPPPSHDYFDIVSNLSTPPGMLEKLSFHALVDIRCSVARHPNTPQNVVKQLSVDRSPSVRAVIASRFDCPPDVLEKLACDSHPVVAHSVAKGLHVPEHVRAIAALVGGVNESCHVTRHG